MEVKEAVSAGCLWAWAHILTLCCLKRERAGYLTTQPIRPIASYHYSKVSVIVTGGAAASKGAPSSLLFVYTHLCLKRLFFFSIVASPINLSALCNALTHRRNFQKKKISPHQAEAVSGPSENAR